MTQNKGKVLHQLFRKKKRYRKGGIGKPCDDVNLQLNTLGAVDFPYDSSIWVCYHTMPFSKAKYVSGGECGDTGMALPDLTAVPTNQLLPRGRARPYGVTRAPP